MLFMLDGRYCVEGDLIKGVSVMRLGALNRVPVLSLEEGKSLGQITGALIDFEKKLAAYLVIDSGVWYKGALCVPFSAVSGMDGAVMVMESEAVVSVLDEPDALALAAERGFGYSVYSLQGKPLGKAVDYDIDICGRISDIILDNDESVPAAKIKTVGNGLIILATEKENDAAELVSEAGKSRADEAAKIPKLDKNYFEGMDVAEDSSGGTSEDSVGASTGNGIGDKSEEAKTGKHRTLIGRRLTRDIRAGDGTLIARENDIITASLLELARALGRLVELSEHSREMRH